MSINLQVLAHNKSTHLSHVTMGSNIFHFGGGHHGEHLCEII